MTEEIQKNEGLNIYQRLDKIREAVAYIQKDAAVQGYKAITHDMVTSEVRPHLIKNGVLVVPRQLSGELRDSGKRTKSDTPVTVFIGVYEIDFVNIDNPEDRVTVPIWGLAEDQNDKGPGKAISYATKTAMLKVFSIETGESDESRQDQKPAFITPEQQSELTALAGEVGADYDKFMAYLQKSFGANDFDEIKTSDFKKVVAALEKKRGNP